MYFERLEDDTMTLENLIPGPEPQQIAARFDSWRTFVPIQEHPAFSEVLEACQSGGIPSQDQFVLESSASSSGDVTEEWTKQCDLGDGNLTRSRSY